jgi:hypothetical protein
MARLDLLPDLLARMIWRPPYRLPLEQTVFFPRAKK